MRLSTQTVAMLVQYLCLWAPACWAVVACWLRRKCFISARMGYSCLHQNFKLMDTGLLYHCSLIIVVVVADRCPCICGCNFFSCLFCPLLVLLSIQHRYYDETCVSACRIKCCGLLTKLSPLVFNLICQRDWYISLLLWSALLWVWYSSVDGGDAQMGTVTC